MNIGKIQLVANCPSCNFVLRFTLDDAAKGVSVTCGGCSKSVRFVDKDDSVKNSIESINQGLGRLLR